MIPKMRSMYVEVLECPFSLHVFVSLDDKAVLYPWDSLSFVLLVYFPQATSHFLCDEGGDGGPPAQGSD